MCTKTYIIAVMAVVFLLSSTSYAYSAGHQEESYEAKLTKYLARFQKYPVSGKLYGLEGDVIIRIQIDKSGRVPYYRIVHDSAHPTLKESIKKMIESAQPVPAPPKNYFEKNNDRVEFMLPIAFRQKQNTSNLQEIDKIFKEKIAEAWSNN